MHMWTTPIEWMYCIDRFLFTPLFVVPLLRYHNIYVCVCVLAGRALYNNWAAAQHRLIVDHHALCCSQLARDRSPRDFVVDTAWQNHMHDASYWWWWPKWRIYPRPQSQITWPSTEKKNKSHTNSIHTECIVFALDLANCLLWFYCCTIFPLHTTTLQVHIERGHWADTADHPVDRVVVNNVQWATTTNNTSQYITTIMCTWANGQKDRV